jgi:hypothetical protein
VREIGQAVIEVVTCLKLKGLRLLTDKRILSRTLFSDDRPKVIVFSFVPGERLPHAALRLEKDGCVRLFMGEFLFGQLEAMFSLLRRRIAIRRILVMLGGAQVVTPLVSKPGQLLVVADGVHEEKLLPQRTPPRRGDPSQNSTFGAKWRGTILDSLLLRQKLRRQERGMFDTLTLCGSAVAMIAEDGMAGVCTAHGLVQFPPAQASYGTPFNEDFRAMTGWLGAFNAEMDQIALDG